jgi:integrase/recombinase XerD
MCTPTKATIPKARYLPVASSSAFDTIFSFKSSRERHRQAPLADSREKFLAHMLTQGTSTRRMRSVASMLLHVVRIMRLDCARLVEVIEVQEAAIRWTVDAGFRTKNSHPKTTKNFAHLAKQWLSFSNMLVKKSARVEPDDSYTEQFVSFITLEKGMSIPAIRTHRLRLRAFLRWNTACRRTVTELKLSDVDGYIASKFQAGYKPNYVRSICASLRLFFMLAEAKSWNESKICENIRRPRIPRVDSIPKGPEWADVRKLLDHDFGSSPAALRAAAITSLGAIYGLRSSEVVSLRLDDFDWQNEMVTIRRAKNDRVQQFPIQVEVGNNVIRYLKEARPNTSLRNLFISLRPPYRPMDPTSLWVIIASRLKILGISSPNHGMHSLRHACATHLLHKGTPLSDIADFLGHTNLRSVSVYAKHDMEALRRICTIDLAEIL